MKKVIIYGLAAVGAASIVGIGYGVYKAHKMKNKILDVVNDIEKEIKKEESAK